VRRAALRLAAGAAIAIVVLVTFGAAVAQGLATAGAASVVPDAGPRAHQEPSYYVDERPGDVSQNLWILATRRIYPVLPGALMLLVFSALFGAINFYSELPDGHHHFGRTWKYLGAWTLTNYAFALMALMLILPADVTLTSVTRQLVLYCLAVAALPELGSNLRLQLGKSKRALDLYRYKIQLSGLITQHMQRASHQDQNRDRDCIASCYADGFDALQQRLVVFVKQLEIPGIDQDTLLSRLKGIGVADNGALLDVVASRPGVMPLLLDFFRDDIEEFRRSPVATLLGHVHPRLTVAEATRLVQDGVTTRGSFIRRTWFAFQRRRLAALTDMSDVRLRMLHYTTRRIIGRRRWGKLRLAAALLLIAGALVGLLNLQADRLFVSYEPPGDTALVSKGLGVATGEVAR
jgi:hypothetical protein